MRLADDALDALIRTARTYHGFDGRPVSDATIHELYETMKWGPTSANSNPGRFVFVRSAEAKARLAPALSAGNHDKTMAAPCTVIVAYDLEFHEKLPVLFPHVDARSWFSGKPAHIQATAFRNSTLQGAYLMVAARALGLDVGAMSGFDNHKVDEAFFAGTSTRSNFLVNLGHGDPAKVHKRNPRPAFDEVCRIE
ncbi:MAG: malonic semialdehyde reductase [Vicinamibacteria bacterium]|jgi:3-hydroxypropanoate dehydrogenase